MVKSMKQRHTKRGWIFFGFVWIVLFLASSITVLEGSTTGSLLLQIIGLISAVICTFMLIDVIDHIFQVNGNG